HGADPVRAALVVVDVGVERLLGAEPLHVPLEPRPAGEPMPAGDLELCVRELRGGSRGLALAGELLRLLAKLLEVQRRIHDGSSPSGPVVRMSGRKEARSFRRVRGVGSALSADWTRPPAARRDCRPTSPLPPVWGPSLRKRRD